MRLERSSIRLILTFKPDNIPIPSFPCFQKRIRTASGIDRLARRNVLTTSDRAVEAARGRDVLGVIYLKAHNRPLETPVPADMLFAFGSGLESFISPEAAEFQLNRVAAARSAYGKTRKLVAEHFIPDGILGENVTNVMTLNAALDTLLPVRGYSRPPRSGEYPGGKIARRQPAPWFRIFLRSPGRFY